MWKTSKDIEGGTPSYPNSHRPANGHFSTAIHHQDPGQCRSCKDFKKNNNSMDLCKGKSTRNHYHGFPHEIWINMDFSSKFWSNPVKEREQHQCKDFCVSDLRVDHARAAQITQAEYFTCPVRVAGNIPSQTKILWYWSMQIPLRSVSGHHMQ